MLKVKIFETSVVKHEKALCFAALLLAASVFVPNFFAQNLYAQNLYPQSNQASAQQDCNFTNGTTDENPLGILLWHVNPPPPPPCAINKFEPGPGYPPNRVWYTAKGPGDHERAKAGQGASLATASATTLAPQIAQTTPGAWEPSTLDPTGTPAITPTMETPPEPAIGVEAAPLPLETEDLSARAQLDIPAAPAVSAEESIYARSDTSSALNSFECTQAATEVTKANEVSDSADKLFHLRKALRLCPDNAQYHQQLGEVYTNLGRTEDASFEFEEAKRLDPNLRSALNGASLEANPEEGAVNYY